MLNISASRKSPRPRENLLVIENTWVVAWNGARICCCLMRCCAVFQICSGMGNLVVCGEDRLENRLPFRSRKTFCPFFSYFSPSFGRQKSQLDLYLMHQMEFEWYLDMLQCFHHYTQWSHESVYCARSAHLNLNKDKKTTITCLFLSLVILDSISSKRILMILLETFIKTV